MNLNKIIFSPVVKTLVFANVFIAICAFSQVLLTYHLFPIPINEENNAYLLFVLLSTYLQYNMQRGYMIQPNNLHSERSQWLVKHKKKLFLTVGISLIALLFLCNNLSWISISIMVGAEIISTFYYLPPFNLRKYGYIKPFLISMIWVVSCSLVPLIENQLLSTQSMYYISSQFFFIASLCLLFDVKDANEDLVNGVNTYANHFGIKVTKFLAMLCLLFALICFYMFNRQTSAIIPSLLLFVISLVSVFLTNEKKHQFYFYLLIDGLLIVQTILFFIL